MYMFIQMSLCLRHVKQNRILFVSNYIQMSVTLKWHLAVYLRNFNLARSQVLLSACPFIHILINNLHKSVDFIWNKTYIQNPTSL